MAKSVDNAGILIFYVPEFISDNQCVWYSENIHLFSKYSMLGAYVIRNSENGYTNMVDACTILRKLDKDVYLVPGNRGNIKITTPEDVYVFKAFLQYKENEQTFGLGLTNKIGTQYDTVKSSNKYNV